MKFILLSCLCWVVNFCAAQCVVCDSTNNFLQQAQAPKEWLELIKDPERIDKRNYEYGRRLQVELDISKEGKL